ncbi:hypothetical protein [Longibacter sp.]|uniref:hypothetical protein n=1 Tax=Longibacter sp. TaxID=2045415 RepID=UPI003EBC5B8E
MNRASIAIMAKIRLLYEQRDDSDELICSFPVLGLPLTEKDLTFDVEASTTPADALNAEAEFSLLVNRIPSGRAIWEHDGRLLWDTYQEVLDAQWADRPPSDAEQAELHAAYAVLYDTSVGTDADDALPDRRESDRLRMYRHYERLALHVTDRLSEAQIRARFSDNPAEQARAQADVERLEKERAIVERDWLTRGYRSEVDEAYADIARIKEQSPHLLRTEWLDRLDRAKATNAVIDYDFYQTRFSPPRFFSDPAAAWTTVSLSKDEIDRLNGWASVEMPEVGIRGDFPDAGVDLDIESIRVDLARVDIVRPWLDVRALRSRAWRWWEDGPALSDGNSPPSGRLPAYVVSMIVARNLVVDLGSASKKNKRAVRRLNDGQPLSIGPMLLGQASTAGSVAQLHQAQFTHRQKRVLQGRIVAPTLRAADDAAVDGETIVARVPRATRAAPHPTPVPSVHLKKLAGALRSIRLPTQKNRSFRPQIARVNQPVLHSRLHAVQPNKAPFRGTWKTTYGPLRLVQDGQSVYGDYDDVGTIRGTFDPDTGALTGAFTNGRRTGTLRFELRDTRFVGTWSWDGEATQHAWDGQRINASRPTLQHPSFQEAGRTEDTWEGTWSTTFGELRLVQEGTRVAGDYKEVGEIAGVVNLDTGALTGTFTNADRSGRLIFERDGHRFRGMWAWGSSTPSKPWTGRRTDSQRPRLLIAEPPSPENRDDPNHDEPSFDQESLQLVAFLCQKTPKAPNPNPDLEWT